MRWVDPIKLCCGHRLSEHRGPQCPDDKVMCCLCFYRFDVADLATDLDGATIDVCVGCFADEAMAMERKMAEAGGAQLNAAGPTDKDAICIRCNHAQSEHNWCKVCGGRTEWTGDMDAPIDHDPYDSAEGWTDVPNWPEAT